jgi:acyl-CoA reductase-like NAD-dependent aldehyde dehydrogenase
MDDQMNEAAPIDFSSLGPAMPADRLEALVAATVRNADEELRRRRSGIAVVRVVIAWRRPLLALSGLAAAAAITMFVRAAPSASTSATTSASAGSVAEALGVPAAYAESVEGRSANRGTDKP